MSASTPFVRRALIQLGIATLAGSASFLGAQAPDGVLRGRVVDAAGAGISGASIRLNGTTFGASTSTLLGPLVIASSARSG